MYLPFGICITKDKYRHPGTNATLSVDSWGSEDCQLSISGKAGRDGLGVDGLYVTLSVDQTKEVIAALEDHLKSHKKATRPKWRWQSTAM